MRTERTGGGSHVILQAWQRTAGTMEPQVRASEGVNLLSPDHGKTHRTYTVDTAGACHLCGTSRLVSHPHQSAPKTGAGKPTTSRLPPPYPRNRAPYGGTGGHRQLKPRKVGSCEGALHTVTV